MMKIETRKLWDGFSQRFLFVVLSFALIPGVLNFMTDIAYANEKTAKMVIAGKGVVTHVPDQVMIHLGVNNTGPTAADALEVNKKHMNGLIELLAKKNIEKKYIQTSQFQVNPHYVHDKRLGRPVVKGYRVVNEIHILVKNIDDLGPVLDEAIKSGINQVHSIRFTFSNLGELKDQARAMAIKDARRKAKIYADAAEVKLGKISLISEQVSHHRPVAHGRMAMDTDKEASVPIEAGQQSIEVSANVTFELND